MAARKRRKSKEAKSRGGSLGGAIFLGMLSAVLGLLLGIAHLATQPAEVVRNLPDPENRAPRTVYYLAGQDRGGAGFRAKEAEFVAGQPMRIALTEAELSTWARENFRFDAEESTLARGLISVLPEAPRFRVAEGDFQIGMGLKVSAFGQERAMLYQARGTFQRNGGYAFKPATVYLGSAKIPGIIVGPLLKHLLQRPFEYSEAWQTLRPAWEDLAEVSVENDSLVLVRR